jgi:murein DD-endopeptidase MepM/ murein hydrolase activator NlpD
MSSLPLRRAARELVPSPAELNTTVHRLGDGLNDSRCRPQVMDMPVLRPVLLALSLAVAMVSFPMAASALPRRSVQGVWPLDGPATVVRAFRPPALRWTAGHRGVDLAARSGAPVRAAAAGTVRFAGQIAGRGVVVVDHGSVRTTYEPVIADVQVGREVSAGQVIGRIGAGSHCAVTCLHWGLRRGADYLDPLQLLSGGDHRGGVRLVGAEHRELAKRAAVARAASLGTKVAGTAAVLDAARAGGRYGFLPPVAGRITSGFGKRLHPVLRIWKLHDGTDYGAPCGSPIRAPQAGRVSAVYVSAGYGNRLMIDHGVIDGRHVITGFNHASGYVVDVGQHVGRGQVIGYVGSTGFSTGCHLHLMLWLDGGLRNPATYF